METWSELSVYLDSLFTERGRLESYATTTFQVIQDVETDRTSEGAGKLTTRDNILSIGLDYPSRHGAALWFCTEPAQRRIASVIGPDIAEWVWVSLNPDPPQSDPEIICDPWRPSHFNRISALPFSDIRSAVEEFFRANTGSRPTPIQWVKGYYSGELYVEDDA